VRGYLDELEKKWRANKQKANNGLARPKTLRGRDFVNELARLAVLTGDDRFDDAGRALFDNDIIDSKLNFRRWRAPAYAKIDEEHDLIISKFVAYLVRDGTSTRRACAEIAATTGMESASFEAACKQVKLVYERHMGK
jgi:hypothetical protein